MSACNYSEKYLPLIEKWIQEGTFETNVKNFFVPEDAEKLLNSMGMDQIGSIPVRSMEVKDVTFNRGVEVNQDSINVIQYYIGNDSQYRRMNTRFKRAMVETAIYNPNNGGSLINANELNGDISFLNEGIIKYKKSLLKSIALFLNEDVGNIDTLSYDELNDLQKTLLSKYRAQMSENDNTDVYDAYVILSNFDQMLKNFAPYITVVYPNSNHYHPKRYQYEGPSVKHYTGVMSNNEYASAEDNASDIAKILLEYFSEIDENGNDIEGAPIGIKGFNSAMTKVYTWAKDNGRISGNTVTDSNALYNIIEDYLNLYATKKLPLLHRTYLTSKLRGIQKYIYGGKIEADLVLSLTHQLEKTMPSNYVEYNIALTGVTDLRYLTERPVLLQKTMLKECINTAIEYWKRNSKAFEDVLKGLKVEVLNSHTISFNGVEVQINYDGTFTIPDNLAIENLETIIENISQLYVDDDVVRIANQIYKKSSLIDLYIPIIAPIILRAKGHEVKINDGKLNDLGRVLSIMYGSDVLNVVKNGAGNSLPLYQMLCLAYRHKDIHERIEKQGNTIYNDNIIYNNIDNVLNPQIRSGVIHDGKFKSAAELTTDEVIHIAILYDFYKNLTSGQTIQEGINKRSGIIGLQSHVYSDKNKHFIQMFDLEKSWKYKDENGELIEIVPAEILRNYIDGKSDNLDSLITAIWQSQKWQLNSLVSKILSDYRKVFKNETFEKLDDVKAKISKYKNIDELREAFVAAGIEFKEEIHASKVSKKWSINESLVYLLKQFDSFESTKKFITEIQFERFKSDASKAIDTIKNELTTSGDSVDVDRMLFAYFITDILFTNNYNQMMVGQVFAHPNKNKRKIDDIKSDLRNTIYKGNKDVTDAQLTAEAQGIFESESFASRWIGQVKRMVIYGATYHSYAQGLDDGVSEFVKTAVIEDLPVETFSITGLYKDDNDSMDGSGLTHPIFSRLQNRSLLDAAVGANKKTIYHDIDGRYGTPTLLKWAEYEITNEKRRNSHSVSLEKIYKKMSSFAIGNDVNVGISPDNLYYRDQKTGDHYRIDYIAIENGVGTIIRTKVNENGVEIRNEDINGNLDYDTEISMPITTIYDIDQLLGGAWAETLIDDRLEFTETNLDLLTKIVCDNKLKDHMIGWLVNKSGMKVGWSNLNTKSAWTDDKPLRYTTLSTRFGGLQMNADHELDQAEVTEMTQVISALEQMGVMHDVVANIYREIGSVCYDSIKDVIQASETDLEKLYQIYGKAIIESFNSGTKDTLGLAQSFCALAQKSLQDNKITYRIPFSSSSINGIFNSTVTSQLIRKAIRRHYSGVAAVLNPSYNIIEYYSVGGMQYRKEELFDVIKERCIAIGAPSLMNYKSVDDFINETQFVIGNTVVPNPFVEETTVDQIDFEDTVILIDENGKYTTPIKIDNLEKYHLVKTDSRRILRHTLRPQNLKGSNTTFVINNQTHSVYESPYTLALRYFVNNNKSGAVDAVSFKNELTTYFNEKYGNIFGDVTIQAEYISDTIINLINEFQINNPGIDVFKHINIFKKYLLKKQQNLLNTLSEGKAFDWYGNQYIPKDVKVHAAQIGMGKKYAKEFGLRKGDSIARIKREGAGFFYRRIGEAFTNNWSTNAQYDHVLYDGNGEKIYVKVLKTEAERNAYKNPENMTLVSNTDYVVIDGAIYHGSEELCSNEGKEIWAYEDERGRKFNLFIVDSYERLQELWNTHEYVHREDNYTEDNYEELIEFTNQKRKNPIIPSQWHSIDELLAKLNEWENVAINKRKEKWAEEKYQTFLTSLQFVGARIPCQNMTSFAPMEVVIFSDVEENEIYLPSMVTWLEGADYDIDKTYLLGYSVDSKGRIHTEGESKKYASDVLKNHVVSGMLSVITNPKTQINLTTPLSVENMQNLAARSILGAAARRMTPYNSACKYMMQIENMVGKNVIGNVATAIKSFFALNYVYNEAFNNIFKALANGDFTTAQELLNKYSFKDSYGNYRTLANVNMDAFDNINWNALPENIRIPLLEIYNWQAGLDDQSLMLAELLNVATDNAKELILKKINADTNWVDIYTSAFVLGEDLNTIGSFMISPEISELISKYSSSLFDPDASFETKIQFIEKNISEADTPSKKYAYTELLERVKIAEELRILGKILKINQGMPTNTADFYEYISKIEYYIESRLNKQLIDKYNGVRNLTSEEWIGRKKYYDATIFPYKNAFKLLKSAIKKYGYPYEIEDLLNSDKTELKPELEKAVTTFENTMRSLGYIGHSYWRDYKAVQEAYSEWYEDLGKVINELKENWKKFSIVRFVKDEDYAQTTISEYESTKVKFNILDVLKSLPHFNEMYKVLALNDRILTVLSKRNEIESKVWQKAIHKYSNGNADILMTTPNKSERKILKSLVDDALIQTWLTTGLTDFYLSSPDGTRLDFDGNLSISKLKSFIETSIIPRLRNNKFIINGQNIDTKSNEFVRRLTFGKHNGESIFKLPFNMSEIDSNPGIKQEYEKILQAFGELRNIHLEGGLTIVDVFYLYNLIVHKDHFGRNSLTRLFEDLISSKDGEKLLVFKFNEWLETINEQEIVDKVLSSWGASHRIDFSLTENSTQIYISTNPLNKSIPFYSGKANGSDSAWGLYLRQQGFIVKDYTVDDWRALSAEQKGYYEQLYQATINLIGTEGWPADSYPGELTRRDMIQADSATSIFAIGTLSNSGKVNGGTKYATYAAISQGKPVYLFNLNNNSWYWYDYNSSSFIRMNDKPNLISGAAVIGTRDDKSKIGAEALRASGHEAIKDIIDRSLKLSTPKTRTVKYTPKGQTEQTYTIIGAKIFNNGGNEVYSDENSGHRKLIFVELALQEKRAVKVEYRNVTYVVNDRNQIFSTSSNKIVYQNENDGNRGVILEKAKEEFAKLQNVGKSININTISTKTEAFGVVFPKQGKTSQALKSEYQQWQIDNPNGIVAYRVKFPYNTIEEVQLGHIGNPFSENARGANTVQQFYDWLVTGNNFGNEKATDEYRRAIISKLLSTPANSPILYYTELNRPSHATVLGYLIANKQLLSNQSSPRVEIYQGYWTRKEVESQTDKIFLFGDNTDDRVNTHYVPSRTQAVIRGLDNAIGIDTKKNRGTSESSYFTDADFDIFKAQVDESIQRAIDSGKTIVIPADGIGTGKAELDKRAPKLFAYLQQRLDELKSLSSTSPVQFDDSIDISEESIEEEPVTIGFDNTVERIDNETDFSITQDEVESILSTPKVIPTGQYKYIQSLAGKQFSSTEAAVIYYVLEIAKLDPNTNFEILSKIDKAQQEILNGLNSDQIAELFEVATKDLKMSEWNKDLMTKLNLGMLELNRILTDIMEDSLHIDSDYIAEREEILRNATINLNPTPVYQTTPSKQSKLIEVVRQANEKGVKGIHIVSHSDLINEDIYIRSANGFVRNGEIYINIDRAGDDTVIHEFGHLYLADAKVNNREKYYELLEKVRQTKLWSDMKTWKAYANKIGSDFDEEVLATMIGDYYKSEFGTDYKYTDLVKEALSLVDGGFIDLINSEILPDLGDTFITNYALSQRTATLKHKLVSDNILKENCL